MILLCAGVFVFIALVSGSTQVREARNTLTEIVDKNMGEVEYDDGAPDIDDDFTAYKNGIYCLVFYENGEKIRGNAPYAELETDPFQDSIIQTQTIGGETYLIYDRLVSFQNYGSLWIRGVTLEQGGTMGSSAVFYAALIALPLLILFACVGGYLIARRSMRPIRQISETAEEIGSSGDLSKRIEMKGTGDELHLLAGSFNRMFDRLEANFEAERHFTSDASHELRTPVTTILAQCEYAFENASGEQELYEALGVIQKQGYRMSHLIESLLQFTRIEQKTAVFSPVRINLSDLTRAVCREQGEIPQKKISLVEDIQPGVEIQADAGLLARMLTNLIRNAYRYGRENGHIWVNLHREHGKINLSVTDNGIGIAPGELQKIWNRFYRVDKSRSYSAGSGLGFGLAMVRQIAELHGGQVRVDSRPSSGSVFTVTFPV